MRTSPILARQCGQVVIYAGLSVATILFLLPLAWMTVTAFKDPRLLYADPPLWLPYPPTLQNFREALRLVDVALYARNSLLISALAVLGTTVSSSLAGFAFALLPARGRRLLFGVLLVTLAVPQTILIVPSFVIFSRIGWAGTALPLIVPRWCADAFYVFLFRQFFRGLPRAIFDSAEIDGCSAWGLYWRIALPLSRPAIATSIVFSFLASWNDYQGPLLYLYRREDFTLPLGLAIFQNEHYTQLQYMMPVALLALLPLLAVFALAQRSIVTSIRLGTPGNQRLYLP